MLPTPDPLSLAAVRRIDGICDQFEQSCRDGRHTDLSALLREWNDPERSVLVGELVLIDLHHASLRGIARERGDYLARLPEDGPAIDRAFQQAAEVAAGSALAESGGTAESTAPRPEPEQAAAQGAPQCVGRYRILRQLGAGNFGIVYLAHDPDLNRHVAIKCPKAGVWKNGTRREMFQREAELAAKLRHSAVVAIYDIGEEESGRPYFVMEYVRGESLRDRLARGRVDVRIALKIAIAMAEGLDSIHQSGLVHRDVKPANVLLDELGNPHIADLGLALDAYRSTGDELAGTFAYMAPEQVRAERAAKEAQDLDHRCDIWAVGVILYEMLVGRRPFVGKCRAELLHQIIHDAPPRPCSIDASVHPLVAQICMKCLAKAPDARYSSGGALAEALRQVSHVASRARSRRRLAVVAACAFLGLAALPTIAFLRPSADSAIDAATSTSAGPQVADAPVPDQLPFVMRGTGKRFADLYAAVDAATNDAIIEVDADGPLVVDQLNLDRRRLTIRAARGRRPVITLADESRLCLLRTAGHLVLEGLDLRRGTPSSRATRNVPSVLVVEAPGRLQVKRCRLVFASGLKNRGPCIRAAQADCLIQDSELYHQNGAGVTWIPDNGVKLSFDNCLAGVENLAVVRGDGRTPAHVEVRRSTVKGKQVFIALGALRSPAETNVLFSADRCYFDVEAVIIQIIPFPEGAPQTIDAVTSSISWKGNQNVFAVRDTYVRSTFGGELKSFPIENLQAWSELWDSESGSVEISASENRTGPESVDFSKPIRERLDWVARVDARQVGFIVGADIDSVGPDGSY